MKKFIILFICIVSNLYSMEMTLPKAWSEIARLTPDELSRLQSPAVHYLQEQRAEVRSILDAQEKRVRCLKLLACPTGNFECDTACNMVKSALCCCGLLLLERSSADWSPCDIDRAITHEALASFEPTDRYPTLADQRVDQCKELVEEHLERIALKAGVSFGCFQTLTCLYYRKAHAIKNVKYILNPNEYCPECSISLRSRSYEPNVDWDYELRASQPSNLPNVIDSSGVMRHGYCEGVMRHGHGESKKNR